MIPKVGILGKCFYQRSKDKSETELMKNNFFAAKDAALQEHKDYFSKLNDYETSEEQDNKNLD
jgi:hypothetical protein